MKARRTAPFLPHSVKYLVRTVEVPHSVAAWYQPIRESRTNGLPLRSLESSRRASFLDKKKA